MASLLLTKIYFYHSRKLFVGGLSWETSQDNLQRYFSRYGEVIDCVVMKNAESGRSRGFGFVTFSDPNNVSVVLQNGPHSLDGRYLLIYLFFKILFPGSFLTFINTCFYKFWNLNYFCKYDNTK